MYLGHAKRSLCICIGIVVAALACSSRTDMAADAGRLISSHDAGAVDAATDSDAASCIDQLLQRNCWGQAFANPTSCDIELSESPTSPIETIVAMDCTELVRVTPDAGTTGWFLDYSRSPAHLILVGSTCEALQANGPHEIEIVTQCGCAC